MERVLLPRVFVGNWSELGNNAEPLVEETTAKKKR
jgi:hypothetical protein